MRAPLQNPGNMKVTSAGAALLLVLLATLGGCGGKSAPEVREARIVMPPPGMNMAAGYFELSNPGSTPLRLLSVSSPGFESVEMHETVTEQGLSRMRAIEKVEVPAHGSLRFEPGGKHLMLMGARMDSIPPKQIPLSLEVVGADGSARKIEAAFTVESAGAAHAH